jgi:hypothetical protein
MDMNNYDNDTEVNIDVVTEDDHDKEKAEMKKKMMQRLRCIQ